MFLKCISFQFIEGVDKRMDCKFVMSEKRSMFLAGDPHFKSFMIAGEDLSISFHTKKKVKLTQSWAIGFSILELSKYFMYKTYYQNIKPKMEKAGVRISVLMSDTDSWILHTQIPRSIGVVKILEDIMDFSNYESDHPFFNESRKNIVGFLKNEVPKDEIFQFVGVRSKTYALKTEKQDLQSRAKGVKKAFKRRLGFEDYEACINNITSREVTQYTIGSKTHQNQLIKSTRIAFSSFDDKRYLLCNRHSVPYGSDLIDQSRISGACVFCKTNCAFD